MITNVLVIVAIVIFAVASMLLLPQTQCGPSDPLTTPGTYWGGCK